MNDLGLTLAWLTVQVAILLAPALVLHALASRRGPVPGAWVAALSLGLVVALNAAAFVPGIGLNHQGARRRRSHRRRCPHEGEASTGDPTELERPCRRPRRHRSGRRTGPGARVVAAGLGPGRARGGRAGGAVPALGEHSGGRRAWPGRPSACSA